MSNTVARVLSGEPLLLLLASIAAALAVYLGAPIEFALFGLTLAGVALFHGSTLLVALIGLVVVALYKLVFTGFKTGPGLLGLVLHLGHEWVILTNLLGLLLGFALLANHFEKSNVPAVLPRYLPDGWYGALALLVIVFVLSGFLDNIAASLIGGTIAGVVFRGKVHLGYLAAIVAASNAGGAGSVVGDTTTTMMWIAGIAPLDVLHAYVAAAAAMLVFAIPAALQQNRYAPITRDASARTAVDWARVVIVALILTAAIAANVLANVFAPVFVGRFPIIGVAVWAMLLATAPWRGPSWSVIPEALKGTLFLLSLVTLASLVPVERLPPASWETALSLGVISAVFDNIPLTALALQQGGYDWGVLAYTVGFGGSMVWFGSSAGVALSNMYPEAKSVGRWLANGWHIAVAYVVGFFVMLAVMGWVPAPSR
jgi:Na+/H+ antiporter NhaD/arsenite permease-like protein